MSPVTALLKKAFAPTANDDIALSDQLKIHSRTYGKANKDELKILAIDIGSNSVKSNGFTQKKNGGFVRAKKGDSSHRCGIGAKAVPNDQNPKLCPDGLKLFYEEALPELKNIVDTFKPNKIVIVCTEAIRSAFVLGDETQKEFVRKLFTAIAKALSVDIKDITLASENLEIFLTEETARHAGFKNCLVVMEGGNSTQLSELQNKERVADHSKLWRMGTRNLPNCEEPLDRYIRSERAKTSWLRASKIATRLVCLPGGVERETGRLLAERILGICPITTPMPPEGYTFTWGIQKKTGKHLSEHLRELEQSSPDDFFIYTFGAKEDTIRAARRWNKKQEVFEVLVKDGYEVQGKTKWIKESIFNEHVRNWKSKIGKRAPDLKYSIPIIFEVANCLYPQDIKGMERPKFTFPKTSMRDAIAALVCAQK